MKTYTITYTGEQTRQCKIEAKSEKEAKEKFWNGEMSNDEEIDFCLDSDIEISKE